MNQPRTLRLCCALAMMLLVHAPAWAGLEEEKESGYIVKLTDTMVYLSKTPMRIKSQGSATATPKAAPEAEASAGSAATAAESKSGKSADEKPTRFLVRRAASSQSAAGASENKTSAAPAPKTSFRLNGYGLTADTVLPEGVEEGTRVTVYLKEIDGKKVVTRIELLK